MEVDAWGRGVRQWSPSAQRTKAQIPGTAQGNPDVPGYREQWTRHTILDKVFCTSLDQFTKARLAKRGCAKFSRQ